MKTIQFKCTLLSDVIINQKAATEGNQKTLDFIPGSAFLGIAASELYKNETDETFLLFHSGKVRFGDAHPLINSKRALKVPASWFFPKGEDKSELFVHHGMPKSNEGKITFQPKQCRDSFIVKTEDNKVSEVEIKKHFAIKSAYDSDKCRSEDTKIFGYESLQAGSEWCFEVVFNDDVAAEIITKVENSLIGNNRIGRSSTAQYGLVKIEKVHPLDNGFNTLSQPKTREIQEKVVFVYAESRLIFIDKYGQPTFTPDSEHLGFLGGEICWDMCQIRTFQYAPYNNKRHTRDVDRCGIEKGSVICISGATPSETEKWVGCYQNEGFGKVLINPEFLEFTDELGKVKYSFTSEKARYKIELPISVNKPTNDNPVLDYLKQQKTFKDNQKFIYEQVNGFVKDNANKFKGDNFASQWGTIRSLAMQFQDPKILKDKIYSKPDSYLNHGVAAEKWNERGRIKLFENFVKDFEEKENLLPEAIINLAAEMAKKCRKEENR